MMDWELYLRMAARGARFLYVPWPVGVFRAHDERITAAEQRRFLRPLYLGNGLGREYGMLQDRYGALRHRQLGHVAHGVMKLAAGGYLRQLRARRMQGASLRWFASESATAQVE